MRNTIEFTCWKKDEPIEVQLEPEAIIFSILPGDTLMFTGNSSFNDFRWSVRVDFKHKGIQLFPESLDVFTIEVFKNGKFVEDWYK